MFSPSLAATTWAMRPGLVSGCYPERGDRETNGLDRFFSALQGRLARLSIDRQAPLQRIAAAIGCVGEALTDVDTPYLDNLLIELRRRFRSQGLSDPLCIRAFALIRETAKRTIHLHHYDSQLMAGWVMLQGQLAEMETGEGKTLAATLAAATAALAGIPTHVITVMYYLAE